MAQVDRFTCEQVFERLNDYLDRELSAPEMQLVREHLDICVYCAAEFDFEASLLREVRTKMQRIALPHDLLSKLSSALDRVQDE